MFVVRVIGYPIDWNGAIPIDCYINPNGNVIINTIQLDIIGDLPIRLRLYEYSRLSGAQTVAIWEAAIKYACESKICR
ncbi:MAG: hypothetical protein EZS28_055640 [Streblomastix strix]|uniref:Uncharacterized protein n=1 Tax=Streblomastix strix TaxID=222440 RepID=A0A5J4PWR9_9EUKA|nr:MAG: hypothetical protein EZS28_055640 [Streblomastix strix]